MTTLPVIFFGHGSPMNALEQTPITKEWALQRPEVKPKAILMISAHWQTQGLAVTAQPRPATVHDFYGFPQQLHQFQYPAAGSPELAKQLVQLLQPYSVRLSEDWGLDHGAWSVLTHLYPEADIPVVQLSLDMNLTTEQHLEVARQLQPLRQQGVLIVASGNIVHNLRLLRWHSAHVPGWADSFCHQIKLWIEKADYLNVANYLQLGEMARLSVPHPDHFLPLLYILGASQASDTLSWFTDQFEHESLSMLSFRFDAA